MFIYPLSLRVVSLQHRMDDQVLVYGMYEYMGAKMVCGSGIEIQVEADYCSECDNQRRIVQG